MSILRELPAAVAVAALTATLVGCGSGNVKDERDQALADLAKARAAHMAAVARGDAAEAAQAAAVAEAAAAEEARMAAETEAAEAEAARMAARADAATAAEAQAATEAVAAAAETARMAAVAEAAAAEEARMAAETEAAEAEAARMAAKADAATAAEAQAAAEAVAAAAEEARMAAETEAAAAETARMAAAAAADAAEATRMAAVAAAAAATKARMEVEDALMKAQEELAATKTAVMEAEAEVARLEKAEADRQAEEQAAAEREMAATSRALYQTLDEKPQLVMQAMGTTAAEGDITATTKSISWLEDDGDGDAATAADNMVVTLRPSGADATMMGEWTGNEYKIEVTRLARSTRDTAMVYTNQAAPTVTRKPFGEVHADKITDASGNILHATLTDAANRGFIAGSAFGRTAGPKTHKANTGTDAYPVFATRGTFDGARGSYRCTGGGCTSVIHEDTPGDEIHLAGGTWTFTPDVGAKTVRRIPHDPIYFAFGWWLRNSDAKGYEVGTFTDSVGLVLDSGESPNDILDINALQGSATYTGHVAGKYSVLPGLDNPTGDVGHFTANVELKAKWGDGTAPGSVSGMVDGFMGADGMAREWAVELQETALTATGGTVDVDTTEDGHQSMQTVWTIGTAADASGAWTAQLYEESPASSPRAGTPTTALGEFTAEHGVVGSADSAFGIMAGAFGATLQ